MKKLSFLILLAVLTPAVSCAKLTPEEDEHRAKTCGRPDPQFDKYPWINQFGVTIVRRRDSEIRPAFLISPRHLVANVNDVFDSAYDRKTKKSNDNIWYYAQTGNVVDDKMCVNNVLKFSEKELKGVFGFFGADRFIKAVSMIYIGNCDTGVPPTGIVIMEIEKPSHEAGWIKTGRPLVPICVAVKETSVEKGEAVQLQTMRGRGGVRGIPEVHDHDENDSSELTVSECNFQPKHDFSFCLKTSCSYWPGGAAVKKVDGAETLLAMIVRPQQLEKNCDDAADHGVSIGFFQDKICEFAGICKQTIVEKSDSSSATVPGLIYFLAIIVFLHLSQ
ncbi:unnamed protein product [Caenorhabditis brenneri]